MADLISAEPTQTPPSGYLERHDYRVDLLARRTRVTVRAGDRVIADSKRTILVDEQNHALVFARRGHRARQDEHLPYKGEATYLALAETPEVPIAWRYDRPFRQVEQPHEVRAVGIAAVLDLHVVALRAVADLRASPHRSARPLHAQPADAPRSARADHSARNGCRVRRCEPRHRPA
jgi:uncharacterized protein (DUF427 family)